MVTGSIKEWNDIKGWGFIEGDDGWDSSMDNQSFTDQYTYRESFKRRLSGSLSMSLSTKLYGIIPFPIGRINSFRHVLSPSVSFSYLPDLSKNSSLFQINSSGEKEDYFSGSLVGSTPTSSSAPSSRIGRFGGIPPTPHRIGRWYFDN